MSGYIDLIQHINNNYEDIEDNIFADLEARDEEFCAQLHMRGGTEFRPILNYDMEHHTKWRPGHGRDFVLIASLRRVWSTHMLLYYNSRK